MLARALEAQGVATTSISMVREHTEKYYVPAAAAYRARAADHGGSATELIAWRQVVAAHWLEARAPRFPSRRARSGGSGGTK